MEWLLAVLGVVLAFVLGFAVRPVLMPYSRKLERIGRRIEDPVDVHVEDDQAVIWAGFPPWMSFSYFIPGELPSDVPPEDGRDWGRWAESHGGFDLWMTMVRVTIVAKTDTTVVVETPMVTQETSTVPEGVGVLKPAPGGADITPRRYDIDLASGTHPWILFMEGGEAAAGDPKPAPSFSLKAGEVEQLHIWAKAEDDQLHAWSMEIPMLIDGRRITIPVDHHGGPFKTVGRQHRHKTKAMPGDRWESFSWSRGFE